jgi:hypothetical protein
MLEICNRKKACASLAALLVTALVPLTLTSQQRPARPAWPKQAGAYITTSSEAIWNQL